MISTDRQHTVLTNPINADNIGTMKGTIIFLQSVKGKEFNIKEIQMMNLFPWATHYKTIVNLIMADHGHILQPRIEGEGRQTRYFIKSENIIKYLNKHGESLMMTVRKNKNVRSKIARPVKRRNKN